MIGFADSDDLLYPDMYETLVAGYLQAGEELAKAGRTDAAPAADTGAKDAFSGKPFLIQTGREEIDEEGKRLPDAVIPPASVTRIRASDFARSLLLYLFEEKTLGEDFGLLMRLCGRIAGVVNLPSTGYRVVHRAGSATRRGSAAQFSKAYVDIVRQADKVEAEIVPEHPELSDAAKAFALTGHEPAESVLHGSLRVSAPQFTRYVRKPSDRGKEEAVSASSDSSARNRKKGASSAARQEDGEREDDKVMPRKDDRGVPPGSTAAAGSAHGIS